jgi:RNA polymerase sigma factor (sigma-70 family)
MSARAWQTVLQQCRGLARPPDGGLTDAQLVTRWLASRDQAAFELLLWRHAATVHGVCRRLLRQPQDVEDAFQATFLIFLRKARTIGKREAVASWLYKVAYRVALQARQRATRLELLDGHAAQIPALPAADAVAGRDLGRVVDDEVSRLPRRYRTVFVLRCLQGKSNEEAAQELGVPAGTVQSRLSRARALLRVRLARRGVTGTAGVLAVGGAAEALTRLPVSLVSSTLRAALLGSAEQAAAAGLVTVGAAALVKGALHAMWVTKVQTVAALVLTTTLLGGSALTYRALAVGPADDADRVSQVKKSAAPGNGDPEDNQRLRQLQEEARRLRQLVDRYKEESAAAALRVKQLEEELARAHRPAAPTAGQQTATSKPTFQTQTTTEVPDPIGLFGAVPLATVQDAKDAVEILAAQLQTKKAEVQAALVDVRAAERNVARIHALGGANAISRDEVDAAKDNLDRRKAVVAVKEAELKEQEVRLTQALRRLDHLQGTKAPQRAAAPADRQQLEEIRRDLERLQRKIEALDKASKPPDQSGSRP